MKKILLLSDTHGTLDDFIMRYVPQVDEVWHAGDIGSAEIIDTLSKEKTFRGVWGNIDDARIRLAVPEYQFFTVEGLKVVILHIGGYPGRYTPKARKLIEEYRPDIFISGHSHILKVMQDKKNGLLHLNPGAAGKSGFHTVRTMLLFDIDGGKTDNLRVIERKR